MTETRVRFPPSPTGYLHIGGARTALYNWLYAKKTGGKLILRIEDTDAERSTQESIDGILDGLNWLGIDWDEGPYFQTEFSNDHKAAANQLLETGHAFKCFCTKEELDKKREDALAAKTDIKYDGTCRNLTTEQIQEKEDAGLPHIVRFKSPRGEGNVSYDDKVLGHIEKQYSDIEDFVIVRSNGKPLYLLCNVVDDIRDRISHIIRGQDHMSNTIRQILLYKALEAPVPVFAHMSLTLDTKKAKISKRSHGEIVAVQFYRDKGFLPWALSNFLVLLGWSSGTDQEIFSQDELINAFSLERLNKTNSIFNYRKGDPKFFTDPKAIAMNEHYLRTMDLKELGQLVKKELQEDNLWDDSYENEKYDWYLSTLDLIRDRFHTLKDFTQLGRAYFAEDYEIEEEALNKNLLKHSGLQKWLPELANNYESSDDFTPETIKELAKRKAEDAGVKLGVIMNGMRTVLTGQTAGPSMFDAMIKLGKKRVIKRLKEVSKLY